MRSAVVLITLIVAIAAEAPYHLPRPAPHSPALNYQPGPSRPPASPPPQFRPQPPLTAPQPNFSQGNGYFYQQPNIKPAFVQPAPQPQYQPAPQPQYHPAPQPQYQPAPQPQYQPAPQPQYQPAPQPQYQPAPQPQYQPAPQPIQIYQPAPVFAPQPLASYPQPITIPSTSYGFPQPQPQFISHPQVIHQPLHTHIQPQPQPQPAPIAYNQNYQSFSQQGYSYQQPLSSQTYSNLPLQSQAFSGSSSSGLSSYQADSNLYSGAQAQVHREALDSVVVDRLQNIIKESEHTSARDAGYLSLVSGVSLESAKPSLEISSFVHSSPVNSQGSVSSSSSFSSSGSIDGVGASAPSSDYGLPTITANNQQSQTDSSIAFLPNSKPAGSYGPPN